MSVKVTDSRTFDLEVNGKKVQVSLSDLQSLYDQIHVIPGIKQQYYWTQPWHTSPIRTGINSGGLLASDSTGGFVNTNTEASQVKLTQVDPS